MVNQLEVVKATLAAMREQQADEERAVAQAPRGVELPAVPPLGGHRGPLYCGDLYQILRRAANRVDLRPIYNTRSKAWNRDYLWTLYVGDPSITKLHKTKHPQGPLMNIRRGMVPEWTHTEDANDPNSAIHCWGWRLIVWRCLAQNVIKPTPEVLKLFGVSNYWRSKAKHSQKATA